MTSATSLKENFLRAALALLCCSVLSMANAQGSSAKTGSFNKNAGKPSVKLNLSWANEKDKQISHFIVERSFDGQSFKEAALVFTSDADDMASYNYADRISSLASGELHYRLKIVDMKGNYHYSPVSLIHPEQIRSGAAQTIKLK